MNILALDTSTPATSVALCRRGRPSEAGTEPSAIEARDDPVPGARPGHAARLLPLAVEVLERGGCAWAELDAVAVGRGPGTFTGLRIGIATARALSQSLDLPLIGVSTLESLALNGLRAERGDRGAVMAVLDARRGEVFAAAWRFGPQAGTGPGGGLGEPVLSPRAIRPEALGRIALRVRLLHAGEDRRTIELDPGS